MNVLSMQILKVWIETKSIHDIKGSNSADTEIPTMA
jgi:hypothetical protein